MAGNDSDITEKRLEDHPDVFADIVNGLLFEGRQVMNPDDTLQALPRSIYKAAEEIHEQERDTAKIWKHGCVRIAFIGLENQSTVDPDMPLRIISYDGAVYRDELNADSKLDKKTKSSVKHRYPVVTLVLYFGYDRHWKNPRSLKDCFDIPDELDRFVSDYSINVFEIAWLTEEEISRFKSDFRTVAEYFRQKRLKKDFSPTREQVDHVYEIMDLFKALTGSSDFSESLVNYAKRERSPVKMESFFTYMKKVGEQEGIKEGESQMGRLMNFLLLNGKQEEALAAANDENVRHEMYIRYGIN